MGDDVDGCNAITNQFQSSQKFASFIKTLFYDRTIRDQS